MSLNIIEGPYLADLLAQSAALRAVRENLAYATLAEGVVVLLIFLSSIATRFS